MNALVLFALSTAAVALFVWQYRSERRDLSGMPAPGTLVRLADGRDLHVWTEGSGPSVIFDAGASCCALDWWFVQRAVARFARAISFDRAGLGWSDKGPSPRSADKIVLDLREALGILGVQPPYVLVGHSLGAMHMRYFASNHPEEVSGMILIDPAHELQRRVDDSPPMARAHDWVGFQNLRMKSIAARFGIPRLLGQPFGVWGQFESDLEPLARVLGLRSRAFDWAWFEKKGLQRTEALLLEDTGPLNVPVVVLTAEDAMEDIQRLHLDLAHSHPRGLHKVVRDSGHFIHHDQPDVVVNHVQDILPRKNGL